ncbi:hypothetical protein NJLHNGOC_13265 [Novacetimonas cocois]|uniref:Uncharacterized protein n=2 Tax=Novacetimonas cocois TaxID=1747507 RepID=A0A365YRE8_9PROT|nr:hypothetical protein NJLHNGOC_13265 [Novacetimonas cocois]
MAGFGRRRPSENNLLKNKKFLVKLFEKSFERHRLFEKRRHPKTFVTFSSENWFQILSKGFA